MAFLLCAIAYAQKDSTRPSHDADSSFVRSYYQNLDIGLNLGSQYMEYRTYYTDSFFTALRPNEVYLLAPSISYRWLSISYSFTPEFLEFNNDNTERGQTRYRRLSTGFQFGQFNMGALWSKTKGFYIANTDDIIPGWKPGDPFVQFPEMEVRQFQLNASYRTNKNFSAKAVTGGDEEQLKSAWTFLPGLNVSHFKFDIPSQPPSPGKTELTNNLDINLSLLAAGTWVFSKHFFVSSAAGPIVGIDIFKSLALDANQQITTSNGTRLSTGFYFGMNVGYNAPAWYAGTNFYGSSYNHSSKNNERLEKVFTQVNVYAGLRMTAPKLLKKSLDWAETILPFLK